jgi:hypothetical protein
MYYIVNKLFKYKILFSLLSLLFIWNEVQSICIFTLRTLYINEILNILIFKLFYPLGEG